MQTRISLRSIKYAAFASEETSCFQAVVCLDGKPVCSASNDGRGGCDRHHPLPRQSPEAFRDGMSALDAYIGTLPPLPATERFPRALPQSLDTVVGDLLTDHLAHKDLTRQLKSGVLYVEEDGRLYISKPKGATTVAAVLEWMRVNKPKRVILNTMSKEEALGIYKEKSRLAD